MAVSNTVPVPSGVNAPSGIAEVVSVSSWESGLPPFVPEVVLPPSLAPVFVPVLEPFPEWLLPELLFPALLFVLPGEAAWACAGFAAVPPWFCWAAAAGFSVGAGSS